MRFRRLYGVRDHVLSEAVVACKVLGVVDYGRARGQCILQAKCRLLPACTAAHHAQTHERRLWVDETMMTMIIYPSSSRENGFETWLPDSGLAS